MQGLSTTSLRAFALQWRRVRARYLAPFDPDRLHRFVAEAGPLLRQSGRMRQLQTTSLDPVRLRAALVALNPPIALARTEGVFLDPWAVAGLGRDEVRNAAVLATFWDQRRCGEIARRFLAACLARVSPPLGNPDHRSLPFDYVVRTEHLPLGEASERIDITIEGPTFLLGVEVKIDADEGDRQLERYRNALRARAAMRGVPFELVLLSRRAPRNGTEPHLTWAELGQAARDTVSRVPARRSHNERLLLQFAARAASF